MPKREQKLTPKEILQTCRDELMEIIILSERREEIMAGLLPRAIQPTWEKIKTFPEDRMSEAVVRAADLDTEIMAKLAPMIIRQQEAELMIDGLSLSKHRQILTTYYLRVKEEQRGTHIKTRLYTWEDVADAVGYEYGYVKRMARDAIRLLDQKRY